MTELQIDESSVEQSSLDAFKGQLSKEHLLPEPSLYVPLMDVNVTANVLADEVVTSQNLSLLKSLQPKQADAVNQSDSNMEISLNYSATEETDLMLVKGAEIHMYKLTHKGWRSLEINRLQR